SGASGPCPGVTCSLQLVSGSEDMTVRVWRVSNGLAATSPFRGHTADINSVAVSPDGRLVASGSDDGVVQMWKISDGLLAADPFVGHTLWISSVAYSPDGTRVISGSIDETVRVWVIHHPSQFDLPVSLTSHDGSTFPSSNDQHIWRWHNAPAALAPFTTLRQVTHPPNALDTIPSLYIACSSIDHCVQVINTADQSHIAGPLHGHTDQLTAFAFSSDFSHLVTGSRNRSVQVWDLSRNAIDAGPFWGHAEEVTSVSLSPDCLEYAAHSTQHHATVQPIGQ
ncbi:hypothetical protein RHS02_06461, partial [Rhizoctonia solani]